MANIQSEQFTDTLKSLTPTEMLATINFLQQRLQTHHQASIPPTFAHNYISHQQTETDVQQSEQKFRAIFDSTLQFTGLLDTQGIILEANRTSLDAVGVRRSQVVGVPFWEAIWWTHSPALQEQLKQGIEQAALGELVRFEAKHILADGTAVYVDFSLKPIADATGKIVFLIPEGRDITGRHNAEEQLRQALRSLEFQKLALDEAAIVAITDSEGMITEVNDKFCQISQYRREEIIGQTHRLINSGFHPPAFFDDLWETIAAGKVWQGQIKNQAKDGSYYWVDTSIVPFLDEQGEPFQYLSIRFDITAHKIAQEKIQEQAALLEVATDAIAVRDLDQIVQFWNPGAEKIYGWSAAEAIAANIQQLIYPDHVTNEDKQTALQIVLLEGEWQGELQKNTKDGRLLTVASRWSLVRDDAGKPKAILSVDTDITERRSLETQFLRTQRLENLGTLASGIAHDLNNVFTPIIAAAQLLPLTVSQIDSRSQRLLELLEASSKRGSSLIKQILSFAKGADSKQQSLQIGHLLLEIANIAQQTFPKNIQVETDISTRKLWAVRADSTQMQQVFMNLVVNGRDAMPTGGKLSIRAMNVNVNAPLATTLNYVPEGAYLVVAIADEGVGMSAATIEQIFDPFFSTKPKEQGTGLGLSTVFQIVKNYSGFIQVTSEVGQGSEFKVYLPAADGDRPVEENANHHNAIEALTGQGELILIVDDEASIREIAKISLEAFNYRTLTAKNGVEAIATYAAQAHEINAIILDWMMPRTDISTLTRTVKEFNPDIPILLTSGSDSNEQIAVLSDITTFLPKPFTAESLLKAVHGLLCP
ncbi:MAG: PAS domain S-box protein [Limnothrix sp.]